MEIKKLFKQFYCPPVVKELISFVFEVSLVSYLLFYLIESLAPQFITQFFNLNILLGATMLSGVLAAIFPLPKKVGDEKLRKITVKDFIFIAILSLIASALIWYQTKSIGQIALVIAILSGIVVFFMSLIVMFGDQDDQKENNDEYND